MRNVKISAVVQECINELRVYLVDELKLSEEFTNKRIDKIEIFLLSLSGAVDYPLCRYKPWRELGYRCVTFDRSWVFAYEVFDDGVIVHNMRHGKLLVDC